MYRHVKKAVNKAIEQNITLLKRLTCKDTAMAVSFYWSLFQLLLIRFFT